MEVSKKEIKAQFKEYLIDITNKYMLWALVLGIIVVTCFAVSDIIFRENIKAFYTRLIPLSVGLPLLVFHLFTNGRFKKAKYYLYTLTTVLALVMMYAKYFVYLPNQGATLNTTGIIVVIFLLALDLKTNLIESLIALLLPSIIFIFIVLFYFDLTVPKIVDFSNLYPILVLGFAGNRLQYILRFKLFNSNYLLKLEKAITKELYEDTRAINQQMQIKNDKILNQKLNIEEKNQQLKLLNDTKDKFLSIISHDLKSPIGGIIGLTDLLRNNYNNLDDKNRKMYISYLDQSAQSTLKLLENLLLWAKNQLNTNEIALTNENIFLIADEVKALLQQQAENKQININNLIPANVMANVDRNIISTVIRNLTSNAIKFSKKNSYINLELTEYKSSSNKVFLKIMVTDNGIGISPENQSKLFSLSEKVTSKGTEDESGTGLGLIICKQLVEKHGGKIWVESDLGNGSTFIFIIPK